MFLIFDFDGTIVDSKQVYYKALEKHLGHLGLNKKEADRAIDVGMSISETLKKVGISPLLRWYEKREIMRQVMKHVNEVKKCKDAEHIKNIKCKKILVSNSLKEFIIPVLKHLEIEFDEIYGADDFKEKGDFIKNYLKINKINKKEVYYIGDRVADAKLAKNIGIKSIIVSGRCAWNSIKELLKAEPYYLVFELDNINDILN